MNSQSTFTQNKRLIDPGGFSTLFDDPQILSVTKCEFGEGGKANIVEACAVGHTLIVRVQCEYLYYIYWMVDTIILTLAQYIAIQKPCFQYIILN